MKPIDQQLSRIIAALQAQGALIHIDPNAPDAIKQAWIDSLMDCPDCRKTIKN